MNVIRSYIGLGSNQGDSAGIVQKAVAQLADTDGINMVCCSSFYKSEPIGMTDQADFINAVCSIDTNLSAEALLDRLLSIESQFGRVRGGPKWGPRTLDLDLLLHGDSIMNFESITLPHPRMHERAFVLYPLSEIAPNLAIPKLGRVMDLSARCSDQRCVRIDALTV